MEAAPYREQAGVAYRRLHARSLLNRCRSQAVPFDWTVNPYRGCALGCRYCYATYTHEFLGLDDPESFHTRVFAKHGGEAETAQALVRALRRGEWVALGTATDPYQPAERTQRITRRFLEHAAALRGLRLSITTKAALVLRDLDLLRRLHERSRLQVALSLISTDAALLRRLEPWAPPPNVRLAVLRHLVQAGLDVRLALAPVLPGLTDSEATLDAVVRAALRAGVRQISCRLLFLRSPTREKYLRFLEREFPALAAGTARAYAGHAYLGGPYVERLRSTVARVGARYGLPLRLEGVSDRPERSAPETAPRGPKRGTGVRAHQLQLWPCVGNADPRLVRP